MMSSTEFEEAVARLHEDYRRHFGQPIPTQIIGWWDPVHLGEALGDYEEAVDAVRRDVHKAIRSNIPIEAIPDAEWEQIVF